jgi:hypothetical protein
MMEMTGAVAAGAIAGEINESLHLSSTGKSAELHLLEIHETLRALQHFLCESPQNQGDMWQQLSLQNFPPVTLTRHYRNTHYLTIHIVVGAACTLAVSVPGMNTFSLVFAVAPTAGQLPLGIPFRWRYPATTTLQLTAPSITANTPQFPIAVLYSDEQGS